MVGTASKLRKRMLFLAPDFPLPVASGFQIRQMNLLKSFSKRFDVTLITLSMQTSDHQYIAELEKYATRVILVLPANKRSLVHRLFYKAIYLLRRLFLGDSKDRFYNAMPNVTQTVVETQRNQPYDILFAAYWYWGSRIWNTTAHKVIDANDVQSHRVERLLERTRNPLERLLRGFLLRRYQQMEASALRKVDLIVAITERDRREFAKMTAGKVEQVVIPTGLDTDYFVPGGEPTPNHIAFFGALRNPMNQDAVVHLIENIWPVLRGRFPSLQLSLIGAGAPPEVKALVEAHPAIHLTGYVEDIRQPLRKATVVVLPLRIGWGIRGRVYEIMSLGVPVIASPVAVEGMELREGDGILLATSPEEYADAIGQFLADPQLRKSVGARGRQVAIATASIAATYDRLTQTLADRC